MQAEIITHAEMRKAADLANDVRAVIAAHPNLATQLRPTQDFLDALSWKGAER